MRCNASTALVGGQRHLDQALPNCMDEFGGGVALPDSRGANDLVYTSVR